MQVIFAPPTEADISYIATHMRAADVAECRAVGFTDMHQVLRDEVELSVLCWTCHLDGVPAALLGVTPLTGLLGETGVPWLLGTDEVVRNRRAFIRTSAAYIERMHAAFSHLLNFVHAENTQAVRWLKHAGFTVHPAQPFGVRGAPFHCFEKRV